MVKFDILPGDNNEYVWASELDRSSTPMTGVLMTPAAAKAAHQLRRSASRSRKPTSSTGRYRKAAVVQGGFTSRACSATCAPEDAAEMRNASGW